MIFIFAFTAQAIFAQTTAFNYQGKLTDIGAPQASYQMWFRLYGAAAGGSQIGSTIDNPAATVADAVFSVMFDFGTSIFTGANTILNSGGHIGINMTCPNAKVSVRSFHHLLLNLPSIKYFISFF